MNIKKAAIGIASRILRFAGILLVIYVSMVFYLALTERRNAFPRAITHIEAEQSIAGKAKPVSCTMEDGAVLGGWTLGDTSKELLLYYPDANEDAAQFLAEVQGLPNTGLVTFNYRGSADNKGTPGEETFVPDAASIAVCAAQINGRPPKFIAGRGVGAILATEQADKDNRIILIDPVMSIADVISEKYRLLYPKFLVRAKVKISDKKLTTYVGHTNLLFDRKMFGDRSHAFLSFYPRINAVERGDKTLADALVLLTNDQK